MTGSIMPDEDDILSDCCCLEAVVEKLRKVRGYAFA